MKTTTAINLICLAINIWLVIYWRNQRKGKL